MRRITVLLGISLASTACGQSPSAPDPLQPWVRPGGGQPATCAVSNRGPDLPPLGPCCEAPNYLANMVTMFRWERFPIRLDIDVGSLALAGGAAAAFERGIREGVSVWTVGTGGAIGMTTRHVGSSEPDLRVTLVARYDDPDCTFFGVCAVGQFFRDFTESERIMRRGRIELYLDQIDDVLGRDASSRSDTQAYIAGLMGHEMGHALGLPAHSRTPTDLMYERGPYHTRPFPYVSTADVNTMFTAYCR